jgi:hypothetical protein
MPGIKDELIAAKATGMLSNDFSIGNQPQAIGGHSDRNDFTYPSSGRTVVIAIQSN